MSRNTSYYEVLGVKRDASVADLRKAYRRLAREYHPDMNKSPEAAAKFAELSEAYEILSDADKRRAYDQFGRAGVRAGSGASPGGGYQSSWSSGGGGPSVNVESIFEQMFGGGSAGSPFAAGGMGAGIPPRPAPTPTKGANLKHRLTITFLTAALGGREQVHIKTGRHTQTIAVTIPPGIDDGGKLRLKGRGLQSPNGGPDGDLIITVEVGRHPQLRREGLDLLVDVPITIAEAGLGATVTVPLLAGSAQMKIPPGAYSGQKMRIKGKGIDDEKGRKGDFYAVVQIVGPTDLSPHQREVLEQLADELKNPRESGAWADAAEQ